LEVDKFDKIAIYKSLIDSIIEEWWADSNNDSTQNSVLTFIVDPYMLVSIAKQRQFCFKNNNV
jgi:hypothetical protein